jgi:peptidoglycan/LPS O-acetylase OafA/YrhL
MHRQFAALRGLAMILVVLSHAIHMGLRTQRLFGYPPVEGWEYYTLTVLHGFGSVFAVPTFLFISGCFFSYATKTGNPPKLSWKVVQARLLRLWWPYLFWSIMFYIVIYVRMDEVYSLFGYLKNIIVGYPFHFIPIMVFYMAISPILVHFSKRFGAVLLVVIALFQLFLLNLYSPGIVGFTFPDWMQILRPPIIHETMAMWGIYFPLGLIYSLNAKRVLPWLQRLRWTFLIAAIVFFIFAMLNMFSILHFPLAGYLSAVTFVLLTPTIKRTSIPAVRQLEKAGKYSYGLYLTNLIFLEFLTLGVHLTIPWLFYYPILLYPTLFILTLEVPIWVMSFVEESRIRCAYHYVFG